VPAGFAPSPGSGGELGATDVSLCEAGALTVHPPMNASVLAVNAAKPTTRQLFFMF
jgi:hypothetical protein